MVRTRSIAVAIGWIELDTMYIDRSGALREKGEQTRKSPKLSLSCAVLLNWTHFDCIPIINVVLCVCLSSLKDNCERINNIRCTMHVHIEMAKVHKLGCIKQVKRDSYLNGSWLVEISTKITWLLIYDSPIGNVVDWSLYDCMEEIRWWIFTREHRYLWDQFR